MQNEYLTRIKHYLSSLEELKPIPTNTEIKICTDNSIKAVIFDIYGTLIISASGDIDKATASVAHLNTAIREGGYEWCNKNYTTDAEKLLELFHNTVLKTHEELKKLSHPYPEIDIIKVWEVCMNTAENSGWVKATEDINIKLLTVVFEMLGNKVFPMPGMNDTLQKLFKSNIPVGIVSNAQFYTPLLMNYFINNEITEIEHIHGFDEEISVYSYKILRSKPDVTLFEILARALKTKYNLNPNEVIFVGNDMLKDIWTASQVGFKTVLYTADKRSLRLRKTDERCINLEADYIIDDLSQIFDIVNL